VSKVRVGDGRKSLNHRLVGALFEWHPETRHVLRLHPPPIIELGFGPALRPNVDLLVISIKAHREPANPLPAVLALERNADEIKRERKAQPARNLVEQGDAIDSGFLGKLPKGGVKHVLAVIDTALRHLPDPIAGEIVGRIACPLWAPPTDPDQALCVEDHNPDARPHGQARRSTRFREGSGEWH